MNDNELRGKLLKELYDNRQSEWTQVGTNSLNDPTAREAIRIAEQLYQHGLIEFKRINIHLGGMARITAPGVDVIEGTAVAPISIAIDHSQTINIHGSQNFQVGNGNSQVIQDAVETLARYIDGSAGTQAEKNDAKSRLQRFLEHPLLSAVVSGAIAASLK
ncbi:MAG: hypothetical protein KGJ46_09240 [Xanthomonadaceae bacterium]|nr:hypothetical protein [Xanthomonadaceae bacterium]MDE2225443.1 hypothetical protein [Xanthomonadaceae bacterium]